MTETTEYTIRYSINDGERIYETVMGFEAFKKRRKEIDRIPGDKKILVVKDGEHAK